MDGNHKHMIFYAYIVQQQITKCIKQHHKSVI